MLTIRFCDTPIICAGTSTGGIGYEIPGRVSDSATVAGNYASKFCAVSCTGRGEFIINYALAAKIVTRVEDGITIEDAVNKVMKQANQNKHRMGLISVDNLGNLVVGNGYDTKVLFASFNGKTACTFLNPQKYVKVI